MEDNPYDDPDSRQLAEAGSRLVARGIRQATDAASDLDETIEYRLLSGSKSPHEVISTKDAAETAALLREAADLIDAGAAACSQARGSRPDPRRVYDIDE